LLGVPSGHGRGIAGAAPKISRRGAASRSSGNNGRDGGRGTSPTRRAGKPRKRGATSAHHKGCTGFRSRAVRGRRVRRPPKDRCRPRPPARPGRLPAPTTFQTTGGLSAGRPRLTHRGDQNPGGRSLHTGVQYAGNSKADRLGGRRSRPTTAQGSFALGACPGDLGIANLNDSALSFGSTGPAQGSLLKAGQGRSIRSFGPAVGKGKGVVRRRAGPTGGPSTDAKVPPR